MRALVAWVYELFPMSAAGLASEIDQEIIWIQLWKFLKFYWYPFTY